MKNEDLTAVQVHYMLVWLAEVLLRAAIPEPIVPLLCSVLVQAGPITTKNSKITTYNKNVPKNAI